MGTSPTFVTALIISMNFSLTVFDDTNFSSHVSKLQATHVQKHRFTEYQFLMGNLNLWQGFPHFFYISRVNTKLLTRKILCGWNVWRYWKRLKTIRRLTKKKFKYFSKRKNLSDSLIIFLYFFANLMCAHFSLICLFCNFCNIFWIIITWNCDPSLNFYFFRKFIFWLIFFTKILCYLFVLSFIYYFLSILFFKLFR